MCRPRPSLSRIGPLSLVGMQCLILAYLVGLIQCYSTALVRTVVQGKRHADVEHDTRSTLINERATQTNTGETFRFERPRLKQFYPFLIYKCRSCCANLARLYLIGWSTTMALLMFSNKVIIFRFRSQKIGVVPQSGPRQNRAF